MRPAPAALSCLLALGALVAGCTQPEPPAPDAVPALRTLAAGALELPMDYAWEPSAAIDPTDGRHALVAVKDGGGAIAVHVTFDQGRNWTRTIVPTGADAPAGSPAAAWVLTGDPVAFFGPDGTAYVGGLGRAHDDVGPAQRIDGVDVLLASSADGGRTFGPPVRVADGAGTTLDAEPATASVALRDQDKPWFAAGPGGQVAAAWIDVRTTAAVAVADAIATPPLDEDRLLVATSADGGRTWTEPEVLAQGQPRTPVPIYGADGTLRVAFASGMDDALRLATRTASGWDTGLVGQGKGQPNLAYLPDGTLLLAAADLQGVPAVWQRGADGWAQAALGGTPDRQARTVLAVDAAGLRWTAWYGAGTYEVRADGPGAALRQTLASGLGGADWEYGDYMAGLAAGDAGTLVAWVAHDGTAATLPFVWLQAQA